MNTSSVPMSFLLVSVGSKPYHASWPNSSAGSGSTVTVVTHTPGENGDVEYEVVRRPSLRKTARIGSRLRRYLPK